MSGMEFAGIIGYALGLFILFVVAKIFFTPIKKILKLILNSLIGALVLIFINMLSGFTNFTVGVNPISSIIIGLLGVPGLILVILVQIIF